MILPAIPPFATSRLRFLTRAWANKKKYAPRSPRPFIFVILFYQNFHQSLPTALPSPLGTRQALKQARKRNLLGEYARKRLHGYLPNTFSVSMFTKARHCLPCDSVSMRLSQFRQDAPPSAGRVPDADQPRWSAGRDHRKDRTKSSVHPWRRPFKVPCTKRASP